MTLFLEENGPMLEGDQNKNNFLVSNFLENFPQFSPYETGGRKEWEILICLKTCSQGSCSYFDLPLVYILWIEFY